MRHVLLENYCLHDTTHTMLSIMEEVLNKDVL